MMKQANKKEKRAKGKAHRAHIKAETHMLAHTGMPLQNQTGVIIYMLITYKVEKYK